LRHAFFFKQSNNLDYSSGHTELSLNSRAIYKEGRHNEQLQNSSALSLQSMSMDFLPSLASEMIFKVLVI
jgi:hypothetical protein